jgi:ankyrin repeat protein
LQEGKRMNLSYPLSVAIRTNNLDGVRELLKEGASPNSVYVGIPVLLLATLQGSTEIVKILLKSGADVNKASTNSGATPLFAAAQDGYTGIVQILLSSGADVNKDINTGATPLYIATRQGFLDIVKILLKYGAEVNRATTTGATPLYIAAARGHTEIVKTLLSSGADPFITYNNSLHKILPKGKIILLTCSLNRNHHGYGMKSKDNTRTIKVLNWKEITEDYQKRTIAKLLRK